MTNRRNLWKLAWVLVLGGCTAAWEPEEPEDAAAHEAAVEALAALGETRGALDLVPDVRELQPDVREFVGTETPLENPR